jgi:hypothetical protein
MSNGGIIRFSDILKTSSSFPDLKNGLLVDTSILFAASFPPDEFNTVAEQLFAFLSEFGFPVYTNLNVRAEFIDLYRRYMIPEGLSDLYSYGKDGLEFNLVKELKSVSTQVADARKQGKAVKFHDEQIKKWMKLLRSFEVGGLDGWMLFCRDFLLGKIEPTWEEACQKLNVTFVSTRTQDANNWVTSELKWSDMVNYVGKFGLGSFDSMILNLFMNSRFMGLVTADRHMAYAVNKLSQPRKFVIVPDKLEV